jgi:hypothetical protein
MGETAPYRLEVLKWDEWNYPVKLSVNGNVYESLDSGLFFIPLKDIEDLRLGVLGNLGISVIVVERVEEGGREIVGIPYTILDTEVQYTGSRAYARIFQFKPRKYLHVRSGGRKVFFMDVLEAYFYALGMVEKLDPRVIPAHKDGWHFDSEIAEAYLEIELKPDMTVRQAVAEVKGIFRKIDQLAANILGDILREKERKKGV